MIPIVAYIIFTLYIYFASGQSVCFSPGDDSGTCKSLSYSSMLQLLEKPDKAAEDMDLQTRFSSGDQDDDPKVSCPSPCFTPEGRPGTCVDIFSCSHLASLLQPPVTDENAQYVSNSKCAAKGQYSVCCPTEGELLVPLDCATTVSVFPVHLSTECCGKDATIPRKIVGGNATGVDEYPWLAIIEYEQAGKTKLLCGGNLISSRYVLTAGHCVIGDILKLGTPKNVRLGEYDTKHDGKDCVVVETGEDCTDGITTIPIERIVPHPGYNPHFRHSPNDIALVGLQRAAPYTDFIRPICLPTTDVTVSPPANLTLYAAGWGAVSETELFSPVKRHIDLPYMELEVCKKAFKTHGWYVQLTEGQVCAGGAPGKDSCKGDSGGPLMYEYNGTWELVGLVSFGHKHCGTPDLPGVYTKVLHYKDWIRNVIAA